MATKAAKELEPDVRVLPDVASLRSDLRARRESIIDAAVRLMIDADLDAVQVRDVAEASGVALGTVYRYFSSKDHLFACALLSWASGFNDRLDLAPDADLATRMKATYRTAARAFEKQPRVYGVLLEVQHSRDQHAAAVFADFSDQQTARFEEALLVPGVAADRRRVALGVMGAVLDQNLRMWHRGRQDVASIYAAIDQAADLLCGPGLGSTDDRRPSRTRGR